MLQNITDNYLNTLQYYCGNIGFGKPRFFVLVNISTENQTRIAPRPLHALQPHGSNMDGTLKSSSVLLIRQRMKIITLRTAVSYRASP